MAFFKNPNNPPQPQPGVYGWFAEKSNSEQSPNKETERWLHGWFAEKNSSERYCLYIGAAGKRQSPKKKGTLLRGVTELQRNTFSSDSPNYVKLDTDFIVGTAILHFENEGYQVFWRHLCNDPDKEKEFAEQLKPILQNGKLRLHSKLKVEKHQKHYWKLPKNNDELYKQKWEKAESCLFKLLYNNTLNILASQVKARKTR